MVPWNKDLDLSEFYRRAEEKGYENNKNQRVLVDCFNDEREKQVWILYNNQTPVGSVASHSLDIMGDNSYRICARTCVFTDKLQINTLRTRNQIITHQHITSQFLIPVCIEWAGRDKKLYITSNDSKSGSQRLVHKIFCPLLESRGVLTKSAVKVYRGLEQTFWLLDVDQFYQQLEKFPRWK
jgi:hypothetical protein